MYDILIIGGSGGFDLVLAEQLTRAGLDCVVLRRRKSHANRMTGFSKYQINYPEEKIIWLDNRFKFLAYARKSKMIISFTGSLIGYLHFLWPLRAFLGLPPVLQWFTGSDATELMVEKSLAGWLFRQYLRFTKLNIGVAYPHAIKNYTKLRTPNLVFIPFPYFLPENEFDTSHNKKTKKLRFFHPSHLDWKVSDPGDHRNSTKGNDRFIRAFARALEHGLDAECVILDRGSDREVAKELIAALGVEYAFLWKPHLTRDELVLEYMKADVVVDQFDVGAFGGIAIEAMALGKPVLVFIDPKAHRLNFDVLPPVLNAYAEDEIYTQIMSCKNRNYLHDLGIASEQWARSYQGPEAFIPKLLFYYSVLTGEQLGWNG